MRFGRKDGSEFDTADFVRVRFVRSGFVQTQAEFPPGFHPEAGADRAFRGEKAASGDFSGLSGVETRHRIGP